MSADLPRSFAAVLTPSGRGAVAVIGIHGPLAEAALAQHFLRGGLPFVARSVSEGETTPSLTLRAIKNNDGWLGSNEVSPQHVELGASPRSDPSPPNAGSPPLRKILYGIWQSSRETFGPREDIVLTRFETHWELGCHGGAIAAAAILRDLAAAGIETVSWQEWLNATAKNRLQASAAVALAAAHTPAAALALLRAASLTERALRELCELLTHAVFEMRAKPQAALEALLDSARWARKLTHPWHIVLAGLPNAGKSSLLNALVGYERAIVFEQPGTTRDVVTAAAAYEGWRWELRDTAGLRATDDSLEALGIERTTAMLAASDVTVLVIDGTRPWSESEPLRHAYPDAIVVRNKSDLLKDAPHGKGEAPAEPLSVSAVTGRGLEELRAAIHARLDLPAWSVIGVCVWDAALEHDLRTLQRVLRDDPAALPTVLSELRTWIV